jgi:hypothetical protein
MFARVYEYLGVIAEALKSRGVWTADDDRAFSEAFHGDQEKLRAAFLQAQKDYRHFARQLGVAVDPPTVEPEEPR